MYRLNLSNHTYIVKDLLASTIKSDVEVFTGSEFELCNSLLQEVESLFRSVKGRP